MALCGKYKWPFIKSTWKSIPPSVNTNVKTGNQATKRVKEIILNNEQILVKGKAKEST